MPDIFETKNFTVVAPDKPHHSRENGGHIIVSPKHTYEHRYEMPLQIASEMMYLTMIVGEAATNSLRTRGLDVVRINYQDNGNWAYKPGSTWAPHVHEHLYIRTSHEKHPDNDPRFQAFPEAMPTFPYESGYYDHFKPLTDEDCRDIQAEIESLLTTEKYKAIIF